MVDKKTVVIFGATGKQGGSIIKSLLSDPATKDAFHIKGVTRDPTKPSAQALRDQGVEPVKCDLDDLASLKSVISPGTYAAFATTNYWEYMNKEREVQQGKNYADACKEAGVQHVIWSSLINVKEETKGALPNVYHFDGKNDVEQYIRQQGQPATFFYPGFYMSNFTSFVFKTGDSLTFTFPSNNTASFPLFDVSDSGKFVKAILKRGLPESGNRDSILGKIVRAATDYYSGEQVSDIISKATGKQFNFTEVSPEDYKANAMKSGMPDFAAQEMLENMLLLKKEYGYYSGASLDDSHAILEEKPTTFEEFAEREKASWM